MKRQIDVGCPICKDGAAREVRFCADGDGKPVIYLKCDGCRSIETVYARAEDVVLRLPVTATDGGGRESEVIHEDHDTSDIPADAAGETG